MAGSGGSGDAEGGAGKECAHPAKGMEILFGLSNNQRLDTLFHKRSTHRNFKNLTSKLFRFSEAIRLPAGHDFRSMLKTKRSQCDEAVSNFFVTCRCRRRVLGRLVAMSAKTDEFLLLGLTNLWLTCKQQMPAKKGTKKYKPYQFP